MLMSIIPVISLWGYNVHEDFLALILFLAAIAELLAVPLSLLNLFLFKKNLSIKRFAMDCHHPLWLCIVCSTILLMYSIVVFYDGNSSVIITSVATMLQLFVAIIAISWFRTKFEELYTHL